jgi:hypothetical protein
VHEMFYLSCLDRVSCVRTRAPEKCAGFMLVGILFQILREPVALPA